jgi:hypothetical protein
MQLPQLVHHGGLGLATGLAPGALAVFGVAQGELTAPQARAVPVASGVTAGAAVLEGDPVLAAPAPDGHGDKANVGWGLMVVTTATHAQALTDP